MKVDDGLEDIGWIRSLQLETLPTASYVLLPNLKNVYFLPSGRDRDLSSFVLYTIAPKCVCIRRLTGARRVSPVVL